METKARRRWLLVMPFLALAACGEEPTGPGDMALDLTPSFAKPEGVGKPSKDEDIPVTVLFADGTDGIRSDGDPFYVHDQDFVSAEIKTNGMFYFQTFDGKRKDPVLRGLTVDLEDAVVTVLSPDDLTAFQSDLMAAGDSWPVFTSEVTLHTRNTDGGMYTMEAPSTLLDAGKIGFNDYGDASWEWRLLFGARIETPDGGVDHYEEGLCITHPDEDTWHVMTDGTECGESGAGVDDVTELWRVVGGVFTHVADFNTPMHLTLTRN